MSLNSTLEKDLKDALFARDKGKAGLLRLLKAALKNEMISLKKQELKDEEIIKILKCEAKKRQDSIEQFTKGNRQDLADKEQAELVLIKKYLPQEMSPEEVKKIIQEVISSMGKITPSQFGQVMGAVMKKTAGQADGNLVSKLVKEVLDE